VKKIAAINIIWNGKADQKRRRMKLFDFVPAGFADFPRPDDGFTRRFLWGFDFTLISISFLKVKEFLIKFLNFSFL